jgi:hypothetical protein
MKKLKLNALQLGATEVLTRAQLKNVLGGDGSGATLCGIETEVCYTDPNTQDVYTCFSYWENDEEVCCCRHDAGNKNCENKP